MSIQTIRRLNDYFRRNLISGIAVVTPALAALGREAVQRICKTIEIYDDFHRENDPHQEHDFGRFNAEGHVILFKIDYYDKQLNAASPDPTDPSVTKRVLTIMAAGEY
jgi:hypothetical protein